MNHKKLRRLYREGRLQVRRCGGRKRALGTRAPMTLPQGPDQRWSLDFLSDELLNGTLFNSLCHVREALAIWKDDYNTIRPHSALGNLPPTVFAKLSAPAMQRDRALRYIEGPAPHPVAPLGCADDQSQTDRSVSPAEIAPEVTGHGLPLSKCEAYKRVYDQPYGSS